jgi:hypothetical protein
MVNWLTVAWRSALISPFEAEHPMIRTLRLVVGGLTAATLLAACSSDILSPTPTAGARFSGGSAGGGTGGGSGTTKTGCTNALSVSGSATESLRGNSFSATYVLTSCQSKTRVSMSATDLTTGFVVWNSISDLAGTIALWTLPYNLTSYRIDATAVAGSTNSVVARASTVISTLDPLPCTTFVHETATVGYYGIYPAIWAATDAEDCGRGGTVHLQITNLTTGAIEYDYANVGLSSFVDFEGAIVSYDTPYRVYAELRASNGELLNTSTTNVRSSVLR